jgi:hypothetical protein
MSAPMRGRSSGGAGGRAAVALALVLSAAPLAACADYKPLQPPNNSAIPEGPGLFTGSDGEWVLFRKQEGTDDEDAGEDILPRFQQLVPSLDSHHPFHGP